MGFASYPGGMDKEQLDLLKARRTQGIAFAAAKRFPGDKEKCLTFVKRVQDQTDKKVAKLTNIRHSLVGRIADARKGKK